MGFYNGNTWFGKKPFFKYLKRPFFSPPSHLFSVVLNLQISLVISAVARQDSSPSSSVNRIVLGKCVTESFIFMNTDVFEERLQVSCYFCKYIVAICVGQRNFVTDQHVL